MEQSSLSYALLPFIFVIGIAIIFVSILFVVCGINQKDIDDFLTGLKMLVIGLAFLISPIVVFYKIENSPLIWTKTANEKLISLNDNNMTNGRFYVRRGYINEDLWYQYMVDVGGGGYVANKVPSNGTTVYFDNENPRCEWYKVSQEWWIFKQWGTRWKLYVPEGTIGTNYTIDLQ